MLFWIIGVCSETPFCVHTEFIQLKTVVQHFIRVMIPRVLWVFHTHTRVPQVNQRSEPGLFCGSQLHQVVQLRYYKKKLCVTGLLLKDPVSYTVKCQSISKDIFTFTCSVC